MKLRIDLLCLIVMTLKPVRLSKVTKIVLLEEQHKQYKDHEVSYEEAKENIRLPHVERTFQDCPTSCKPYTQYCHSREFLDDHCECATNEVESNENLN